MFDGGSKYSVVLQFTPICCPGVDSWRCSIKMMFLKISQNSQENTCARVFFNKVEGFRPATLLKKRLWHRCLLANFAKILKTLFLQSSCDNCFDNLSCNHSKINKVTNKNFQQKLVISENVVFDTKIEKRNVLS